ncbi:glycoside hydrolase family 2 protein [Levilactobacillus fujinensis]|uniref:Glycoside hydrolase family 2 TIM barrel-domain containing protein n=1 Tax=Levilactobacillus fujinensis TaxID=2486024 RepID=A0ABW1TJR8_9LACO|nr:glycoside hydrolase family 2 TIM barrel-domain containing protein [Levilactobacillus fujinensis]
MESILINESWKVKNGTTDVSDQVSGGTAKIHDVNVDLPYDGMLRTQRRAENDTGSDMGFFAGEDYEYVKEILIDAQHVNQEVFLKFKGVMGNTTILVNNQVVGRHPYGYTGFTVAVQDYVVFGQTNTIKVVVKNKAQPASRWYTGSGIFDDVWLLFGQPLRLSDDSVHIQTESADADNATLVVSAQLVNREIGAKTVHLKYEIFDSEEQVVASRLEKVNLKSTSKLELSTRIYLASPRLWSVATPNLYRCRVSLLVADEIVDKESAIFGVRTLALNNRQGLMLNGKVINLKGGCVHPDEGFLGAAIFKDNEERKVKRLKSAGYNAIRSAHNPMNDKLIAACDKYGMLVIDEFTDVWTQPKTPYDYALYMEQQWEQDLTAMVNKDFNHPSVIIYSIGNEIPETGTETSAFWGRKFIDKIRSLDATRYVLNAINPTLSSMDKLPQIAASLKTKMSQENINDLMNNFKELMPLVNTHPITTEAIAESCDMVDIIGYNYAAARYELDHQRDAHRVFIGTETNPSDLATNWDLVTQHPYVLGDFSWTAWDYLGETGVGRLVPDDGNQSFTAPYPWVTAYCGDFDLTGNRKPVSYWRSMIWNRQQNEPYIAVQRPENFGKKMFVSNWSWTDSEHSWTWPGFDDQPIIVEVYATGDEVELFLNDQSLGKKPVGDDFQKFYSKWQLTYQPGTLKAVTYKHGVVVGESNLQTVQATNHLAVQVDNAQIQSGEDHLCFIEIEAVDQDGLCNPIDTSDIRVTVTGPGTLQALGTSDPCPEEGFTTPTQHLFKGQALGIVRLGQRSGTVTVRVAAENLAEVTTEIKVN